MTAREAYRHLKQSLAYLGQQEAEAEAREALCEICGIEVRELLLNPGKAVCEEQSRALERLIARRSLGEPLAYVLGSRAFYGLRFSVTADVLIPRQETELLVERCICLVRREKIESVLDLCTGSGCIAVCLANHTDANVCASDLSPAALKVARENAENLGAQVRFLQSDLLQNVPGRFGLIVSNPPYLSDAEYASIPAAVREREPALALRGGADGLYFYRRIAKQAPHSLLPGGYLALEIGFEQAEAVGGLLRAEGFGKIEVFADYAGLNRMVFAKLDRKLGAE